MRLPWVQVTQEAFGAARALSGVLGCDRHRAMSLMLDLWAWGLDLGPADESPTGITQSPLAARLMAGAVEWQGDVGELVDALEAVGLLEVLPEGLQVRGMDRYASITEKRKKERDRKARFLASQASSAPIPTTETRKERGKDAEGTRKERGNGASVGGKTQTQTQTQTHIDPPVGGATPDDLRQLWNQHRAPEQPEWREVGEKRAKTARARLRERPLTGAPNSWEAVIQRIARSSFCRGMKPGSTWVAGPEFLLRPDTATKALEGQYDDRGPSPEQDVNRPRVAAEERPMEKTPGDLLREARLARQAQEARNAASA